MNCKDCAEYGSVFCKICLEEEAMTTADAGIPQDTKNMGPSRLPTHIFRRRMGLPINVTDRRRRKDKPPRMLKKFRKYHDG